MRTLAVGITAITFAFLHSLSAAEYGGRWTDEAIRERSVEYIENTKQRFEASAARIADLTESPFPIEYRELTEEQQRYYEKFLNDRISDSHREGLLGLILRDLESVRARLAEAEKSAFGQWEALPKSEQIVRENTVEGMIYGTEVSASRLGVVLDNSPSMRPYLEAVRAEIGNSFPNAHFREAAGSGMSIRRYSEGQQTYYLEDLWFYSEIPAVGVNPFDPKWHQPKIFERYQPHYRQVSLERNPLAALRALVENQEVDALYWFCDFEDDIDKGAFELLKQAIESHEVAFYVHSSNRRPKREIADLAEDSGGEVIRKRIR
ncbi:MAG: hypothetical protein P1U85_09575 [Verrucomicrobiales bacterium]|nr:hypothetical protein [Verrucomicrobiales bacterium]